MKPFGFWDQIKCMIGGHEPAIGFTYVLRTIPEVQECQGGQKDTAFEVVPCRSCGVLFWASWVGAKTRAESRKESGA